MKKLALIYGGASPEHSVSCVTALGVLSAIDKKKYQVIPVGITPTGRFVLQNISPSWKLADYPKVSEASPELVMPLGGGELRLASGESLGTIDIAFPVLHGVNGEDGTIQGLLQLCGIPYVGNGVLASALAMDKAYSKSIFQQAGLTVAEGFVIEKADWDKKHNHFLAKAELLLSPACFVKPARSGSSVGVTKVKQADDLQSAIESAFEFDDKVLVEKQVVGREVECSVLQLPSGELKVSLAGEIKITTREFYDYEAKYIDNSAELLVPTELSDSELAEMQRAAIRAFEAIGCSGLARTDFFLTEDGFVITEINTMPGFTPISMYPSLFAASGIDYPELIETLIQTGFAARR
ncbi:MAG: D-alanine--D-alanine ligase family protein [Aquiluna sp.]